jgi:hypothetical protein
MKSAKENAITAVEIAETNFLMALKGIKSEDIAKQVHPEVNTIAWIVGHLVSHMDSYLSIFTGKRFFSEEQRKYFAFKSPKRTMKEGFPHSFVEIIDNYLEISENYFKQLKELPEEKFDEIPPIKGFTETYLNLLHRISLHYLGHVGQIVLIRRMIGLETIEIWKDKEDGWSFVAGISQEERKKRKEKWLQWWKQARSDFD